MRSRLHLCIALAAVMLIGATLLADPVAAPFKPGNIVVYRIGNGSVVLAGTGHPVFLDEYSPTTVGGTPVQSIALPTAAAGAQRALVASGTATTDGLLTRSVDGTCLVVPGYGRDLNTGSGPLTTTAGIPRVVGRVTAAGLIDTSTALLDANVGGNFRGAASIDCSTFWTTGSLGGVSSTTIGSTTSNNLTNVSQPDVRGIGIFAGQLFASWNPTPRGVGTIGTGTPTSGAQPVTRLPGLTDANSPNSYQFFFADLSATVAGLDTLYVADAGSAALSKFSLSATGTWTARGTVGVAADVYRGLAGTINGTAVTLYATRRTGTTLTPGGELVTITDASGYNGTFSGTPTLIATAAPNTVFRGVALAPQVTITPSAGPHGSISPSTPQLVDGVATRTFTLTPDAGYLAVPQGTCTGTLVGNLFTVDQPSVNCTVIATFTHVPLTVTPSAGPHGSISPNTPRTVPIGDTLSFTITPEAGYVPFVGGTCTGSLALNVFTLDPVTADCTVIATFTQVTYTVTPSADPNGSISPDSPQSVPWGTSTSFEVMPAHGFSASVGGSCGGVLNGTTYTTNPVFFDCTVSATFSPLPRYNVTSTASANGAISPSEPQLVISGDPAVLTIVPDAGYSVAIRGTCGGVLVGDTFTTSPVTSDCTLEVVFARKLVLFVGNSFTFGRVDPVMSYNTANVTDLTHEMWLANDDGSNADEPHPWGGIPGIFKKLTDEAGLDYDVSISARNAASLRGHYLNTNPAGWDLRGNIASQQWDTVILQDLSDEPLPPGRGANANLSYFDAYVDKLEAWIHGGAAETYTESQLFGGSTAACQAITGASANGCESVRTIAPANGNARQNADVFLYETWARPDMIGPNGDNDSGQFYTAAEGIEAMTADFHTAYFDRAAANARIAGVSPVGDAFLRAVQDGIAMRDPYVPEPGKINLWHTDHFHPSKYGSYLSALVQFATITGLDPMTLGAAEQAAFDLGIAPAIAVQLQRVARATVMPDSTAPVTTATVSTPPNGAGWNNSAVTVTLAAADNAGGSGVSFITYLLSGAQTDLGSVPSGGAITISAQGVTTITYFATDVLGNSEASHTLVVRIDSTPPTLLMPANFAVDATAPGGASVSYAVTATDNSGLAPATSCLPASGSMLPIGTRTITCTATDAAGNTAHASFTASVRGVAEQTARLITSVLALRGINVNPVVTALLTAYLQAGLNVGNGTLLCAGLNTFANQVTLLSGRLIPAAQAAPLIASANRIRAVQGCH